MNESASERNVRQGMDYGESSDVHQVHAAIQREKREPRVGLEPLSITAAGRDKRELLCKISNLRRCKSID